MSSVEAKREIDNSNEEEASPVKAEPKKKEIFKSSYMKQFAVKRAERPPMP
jgi:hypothetical protein